MKRFNGGLRGRIPAARLALCLILVAVATLGRPTPSQACGLGTHHEVIDRAYDALDKQAYRELALLIASEQEAVYAGAVFPDWAYGKNGVWGDFAKVTKEYGVWAEAAHNEKFLEGYLGFLLSQRICPVPPSTTDRCKASLTSDEKWALAFFFGLISHQEADGIWHVNHTDPCDPTKNQIGFETKASKEEDIDGITAEVKAEAFVNQYHGQAGKPPITSSAWGFPPEAVWNAYNSMGYQPGAYHIRTGMWELAAAHTEKEMESTWVRVVEYEWQGKWKWISENLVSYKPGGLEDCTDRTVAAWQYYWDKLTGRPDVARVTISGPTEGAPGSYTFTAAFEPLDAIPPVSWAWDNGETGRSTTRQLTAEETYTLSVTATNWVGAHVTANHTIVIAAGRTCPAGPQPSGECNLQPSPYYVVINGQQNILDRNGGGCSPFILHHPECTDCATCNVDVQSEVCEPYLTGVVPEGQTEVVYEMCQAGDAWRFRVRPLDSMGNCPIDEANPDWLCGLPPGTGIKLPAPVVVGGLTMLGTVFLVAGWAIRRRES